MRFEEAYGAWRGRNLSQEEAANILGVSGRTFRRYVERYDESGLDGLVDKRLSQASHQRAPVDEVIALENLYRSHYEGWNVKHFLSWYKRQGGTRSYTWVKTRLQDAGLRPKASKKGAHRKRRERSVLPGMILHQDGSNHEWVPFHPAVATFPDCLCDTGLQSSYLTADGLPVYGFPPFTLSGGRTS